MNRAVIIGGSGFIGRWLARTLIRRDFETVVVDLKKPAESSSWVRADARDADAVAAVVQPGDAVVHLVHSSIPEESMADPAAELKHNVIPFVELLERLAEVRPGLLVYSSSGGQIYGEVENLPIREDAPCLPVSVYGAAKLAMEQFLRLAGARHGLPWLIVRISNPYGPYQELTNRHGVIPHLMRSVMHNRPFMLYGGGITVRDYVYIEDVAEAVAGLIQSGAADQIVNIGAGVGTSLSELIELVERVTGGEVLVEEAPLRKSDVKSNILDVSLLQSLTGADPGAALEDGLLVTWEYLKANEKA